MLERVAAALAVSATVASPSFAANQYNANSVHRVTELLTYTYEYYDTVQSGQYASDPWMPG